MPLPVDLPARLKSLELHGYKTFANRTLFEFAGMVTAIVGPNGSGKSNIADSLRWVLGEQSYSLLRGKKTEDMIFSGSESRPRAGMAAATVTFDNSDGWLPIDFSEVAVTRRAYRDGQNEYLINGQRVRLRDVSELLAQSGLAERTYTVIGQGLVDAVLSLKAEERRRLFEEAAGIGLHRSRREEAFRRLETTRRNLERVQDILAELQPRLNSLERQARRALEYEQVRADLHASLHEWYGYHWHRAQQELAEARTFARSQEARLEQARQEQSALDQKTVALRQRVQSLRGDLNAMHRSLAELHARREALNRELAVGEERTRSLNEQQERTRAELANLEVEEDFHHEQLSVVSEEIEGLKAELADAQAGAEAARIALAARQTERLQAEAGLQAARQGLSALNERMGRSSARLSERQAQVERMQKNHDTAAQAFAEAEQDLKDAQANELVCQRAEQEAVRALEAAAGALLAEQSRVEAAEQARQLVVEELTGVAAEIARLKAHMEVLEQAEASLTGYAEGTRRLLLAARQQALPGARGALSSFLETPAELEQAISAALGEYLDAVLLDGDPDQALDLLEGEAGRGVLLPLPALRVPSTLDESSQAADGLIGVAASLVQVPAELKPAVDLLLGRVLVVEDRRAARLWLASQPEGVRAVTLRGEVFHAAGPIHRAGGASSSGGTLLSRARQRRELLERSTNLEERLVQLDESQAQLAATLKNLQDEALLLEGSRQEARQQLERTSRAAGQARLAVEQAERRMSWQQEQRLRLEAEIAHGQTETAELSDELVSLERQIAEGRSSLRQQSLALEALALDENQAQVAHWNTLAAVAERAMQDAQTRLRDRQSNLERSRSAQKVSRERLAGFEAALQALEGQRRSQGEAEAQIDQQINQVRAQIEPAETELRAAEGEQAQLEQGGTALRQAVSAAEHNHAQARIGLARKQEELASLRRRIEDDFGLVAFEYAEQISGPTPLPLAGMVEQLPRVEQVNPEAEELIKRQRAQLRRMGPVNPEAQAEYQEVKTRFEFLTEQTADLHRAEADVRQVIAELDTLMQREFHHTFDAVAVEFREIFTRLFGGGSARLALTDPEQMAETGIDIEARLPGRRTQSLALLSGGERSLTATALIFALLKVSPTPFCVLDEVDAMLDEVNVGRFRDLLGELSQKTQFVIITHNRNTVQVADVIYGVTMGRDSASQVLSLKLNEVGHLVE